MSTLTGVVVDLARHPEVDFAVVIDGQLLPMRFLTELEAIQHLGDLSFLRQVEARPHVARETQGEAA